MKKEAFSCLLISDFTIDPLIPFLAAEDMWPGLECITAPYNQVRQTLQDHTLDLWKNQPQLTIIWTQPDRQIAGFAELMQGNKTDNAGIEDEAAEFAACIKRALDNSRLFMLPLWSLPACYRGLGLLDFNNHTGIYNTLMRMNLKLADEFQDCRNVYLLNPLPWAHTAADSDPRMWYLGKIPYSRDTFKAAAREIKAGLSTIYGKNRKLLILDLDNTLWGGELGDLGIGKIQLGGIDPIGEAFVDFQKALLTLKNRGILLAIASKNDQDLALAAIKNHPAMILKMEDFAAWSINWNDKAKNIAQMILNLNLGIESAVFIDDNPAERARVKEALPEIFVPDWPEDFLLYKEALLKLHCFDNLNINKEDKERTRFYREENNRKNLLKTMPTLETWLHSLNISVSCESLQSRNLQRAAQLFNKTNQFNLITRRMDQEELEEFINNSQYEILIFSSVDRIGEYGIIGLASFQWYGKLVKIYDFLLSCRAMGRGIEHSILYTIAQFAIAKGCNGIMANYIPTEKNKPCADFLVKNGFIQSENHYIHTDIAAITLPSHIHLKILNKER